MKWQWLHRTGEGKLLLFCNGWGMDARVISHLQPDGFDLLMLYDYSCLDLPDEVKEALKRARSRSLLGWSMGVWIGSQVLANYDFEHAVACNGTLCPISDSFGISPTIFQGTLDAFDQLRRQKFYKRMCGKKNLSFFLQHSPIRSVENQRAELAFFWELRQEIAIPPEQHSPWKQAVIAQRDLVIPTVNQHAFWDDRIPVTKISGGHYPFTSSEHWTDYLRL